MPVSETISALEQLRDATTALRWTATEWLECTIGAQGLPLAVLRQLREGGVVPLLNDSGLQSSLNSDREGTVPAGVVVKLRAPRVVSDFILAQGIADLLSIPETQKDEPDAYAFLPSGSRVGFFSHIQGQPLDGAGVEVKRYHDALTFWAILREHSEARNDDSLLFIGIRRTEIAPGFALDDLKEDIKAEAVASFVRDTEGKKTRQTIFRSVLSEFLRDQKPSNAFPYLLRNSEMFDRRLQEGLAIYLAEHSPEKLAEEARDAALGFSEKLEKIIGGLEAKSLSIPAAVLLAVKEVAPGAGWTVVNDIIAASALTYGLTMTAVDCSQQALLTVLKTTITAKRSELQDKGLDHDNPVLSESLDALEGRMKGAARGSTLMCWFSWVPVVGVLIAIIWGTPPVDATAPRGTAPPAASGITNQAQSPNPYDIRPPLAATNRTPAASAPAPAGDQ